jgi:tRNA uridine 5-carboxymethylaminomethyl modification enzyme
MNLDGFDIIVIGAGHAGCEAALACARMGARTLLATMNLFTMGQMSCNPAIGGLAKGHLVKEIDALGGEMGVVADDTGIQFRMLNTSKGPAVWSPRSQNDRIAYSLAMKETIERQSNLFVRQVNIIGLQVHDEQVTGVITDINTIIAARAVIICSGTFLNGLLHVGLQHMPGGRSGELASIGLSDYLAEKGIKVGRLKTGTPPRVDAATVDFSAMKMQPGDESPTPFSHKHETLAVEQMPCFLTRTTAKTHEILKSGFDRSPLYTGIIKGVGPRYCPSIEDKIYRFGERDGHQIFLEPDGRHTREYYVNGFSSSLPEEVQIAALRTIPGLEKCQVTRLAYAIEYDYFPPTQLQTNLESKQIKNLFFAGQVNGTSGYEEAAAQGLMAGINAVRKIRREEPFILDRAEAYIGVLIDDLVTKEVEEPYRMFTSLAEHRLLLRQDNADLRLMKYGHALGLIADDAHNDVVRRQQMIREMLIELQKIKLAVQEANTVLAKKNSSLLEHSDSIYNLVKRPEINLTDFSGIANHALFSEASERFWQQVREQVEIEIKYEGFLNRQNEQVQKMKDLEQATIPGQFDYDRLTSLSREGRDKLKRIRPHTLGQAGRILGVSPSDIAILMVYLHSRKSGNVPRGTEV